jgi:hypothetical protein
MEEILERCKNNKLEISSGTIGECLEEAYFILSERIHLLEGENGLICDRKMVLE